MKSVYQLSDKKEKKGNLARGSMDRKLSLQDAVARKAEETFNVSFWFLHLKKRSMFLFLSVAVATVEFFVLMDISTFCLSLNKKIFVDKFIWVNV